LLWLRQDGSFSEQEGGGGGTSAGYHHAVVSYLHGAPHLAPQDEGVAGLRLVNPIFDVFFHPQPPETPSGNNGDG
jgi:hypothetical protein